MCRRARRWRSHDEHTTQIGASQAAGPEADRGSAAARGAAPRFHNGGGMTNTGKPDRGIVELNSEECKGCGLCVEACPPKVLLLADHLNRYGYHPAAYAGVGDRKSTRLNSSHLG